MISKMTSKLIVLIFHLLLIHITQTDSVTVKCPAPGTDTNRYIEDSDIASPGSFLPEDWIWFSCKAGYILSEDEEEITCNEQGQWEPVSNPRCRPATCQKPPTPAHGRLDGSNVTEAGGTMGVVCDDDFEVDGRASLECVGSSIGTELGWDRHTPRCIPVTCPGSSMVTLENGRIIMTGNRIRDTLTAVCQDGYILQGPTTRICTASSTWDGSLQTCQDDKTVCGDPGTPIAGRKIGTSYNTGDLVEFECEFGWVMLGSANRTCLINGLWSGKETRCLGRREAMDIDEATNSLGTLVREMSQEVRESNEIYDEMKVYEGKPVIYGDTLMAGVNLDSRTSLRNLRTSEGLDLYILIDTSASIKARDMTFTGIFVKGLVDLLGVSLDPGGTRISLVAFNNSVWNHTLPSESDSAQKIKAIVDEIVSKKPKGGTSLDSAFKILSQILIPDAKVAGRNAPTAVVIITDGLSNVGRSPVEVATEMINQYGDMQMEFYCIGVGNADKDVLKGIAEANKKELQPENLIFVKDRQTLDVIMTLVTGDKDYSYCGIGGNTRLSKGIKSVEAQPGAWPWMVELFYNPAVDQKMESLREFTADANKHHCGATILPENGNNRKSKYLLSAAHCFATYPYPHRYTAKFGGVTSLKIMHRNESSRVITRIKRFFSHADFEMSTLANDIAIVELENPIEYRADIRPVCLPNDESEDLYKVSKVGIVTGWGRTSHEGETSLNLKQLHVAVQDTDECKKNITTDSEVNKEWNFCAGGLKDEDGNVIDACQGDSGGPLIMWAKDPKFNTYIFTQTGIVSFGEECRETGKPGVYTRTSKFVNWIKETTACMERNPDTTHISQSDC